MGVFVLVSGECVWVLGLVWICVRLWMYVSVLLYVWIYLLVCVLMGYVYECVSVLVCEECDGEMIIMCWWVWVVWIRG